MRRIAFLSCALTLIVGCRPAAPSAASATAASRDVGKIPITTPSDSARALLLRGRTLNESLKPHEAYALFQQAVAIDTTFAFGEYSLAATAPTARDATEHLQRALRLADHASAGEQLLVRSLQARKQGRPDRARQLADSLVALYPNDERAHWTRGNACSAQQQYECAIAEFRAAIAISPTYSLAYNQLGYVYRSAGRLPEAETAFQQYIALVPNDTNPYDSYAELLMAAGRFDESIAQYRKALRSIRTLLGHLPASRRTRCMLAGTSNQSPNPSDTFVSRATIGSGGARCST